MAHTGACRKDGALSTHTLDAGIGKDKKPAEPTKKGRKGKAAPEPEKGKGIDSMEYQHILTEKHGKALGVLEILKIAAEYAGCLLCTL